VLLFISTEYGLRRHGLAGRGALKQWNKPIRPTKHQMTYPVVRKEFTGGDHSPASITSNSLPDREVIRTLVGNIFNIVFDVAWEFLPV
jgi:hypothetical protein